MNRFTKLFLVLLRLAIGWHFLFEGIDKLESVQKGPTETSRPFTSAAYLRQSTGPLGDFFRHQAGDLDEETLARLTLAPLPSDQDPEKAPPHVRCPPALAQDWDDYVNRFVTFYQLDDQQRGKAEKAVEESKDQVVKWLINQAGPMEIKKTFPSGTVSVKEPPEQRIQEYRDKLQQLRDLEPKKMQALGRDVDREKWAILQGEVAAIRGELTAELDKDTANLKKNLDGILTPEQRQRGPVPDPQVVTHLKMIDQTTIWLLIIVGACLLLGLFSRLSSLVGALFLLMLYLSMPALPWVPESLRAEGHYIPLFVNKVIIEMLALLVLATTHSGRWLGLDGLLQFLNPWRWRARPAQQPVLETRRPHQQTVPAATHNPTRRRD